MGWAGPRGGLLAVRLLDGVDETGGVVCREVGVRAEDGGDFDVRIEDDGDEGAFVVDGEGFRGW